MSSHSGSSDNLDTWEVVSRVSSNELEREEDEFDSDSDIEVVSMDTDPECELPQPSSPSLAAGSANPVFILRVPSTEAAIDDLTGESDESAGEEDGTMMVRGLHVACHRQDEETSSGGEEKSDTTQGSDEEVSRGEEKSDTTQGSDEVDTAHRSEGTDLEPVSSFDLSSSSVSVTSIFTSSDTDITGDTCTRPSLDEDVSHLLHTTGSTKAPSNMESLRNESDSIDTTLTGEKSLYNTDEDISMTDRVKSSRMESMLATESFLPLPTLPAGPVNPDSIATVTGVVQSSKPQSEPEEDKKDGESVPENTEVEKQPIGKEDNEDTHDAVLEEDMPTVELQEELITEVVQPQIEDFDPGSFSDKEADTLGTPEISDETTLITRVKAETTDSEIIMKTLGNVKYVILVIVMAALCGYIFGSGSFWNTPSIETGLAEANKEIAYIQEQLQARDTKIKSLQRSIEWMTESASYDLEKLQSSNTELVFDPSFTEGYEYRYYLFTFGKYDEQRKELLRRDEMTIEQIQRLNSMEWMDRVNHLEQEKADLIQQIGMMRYGSPPSVPLVTAGNQVPSQEDKGEQDFNWFTLDLGDRLLDGQVHVEDSDHKSEGQGHMEDSHVRSEIKEYSLKLDEFEDKIVALENDLLIEKARSEKWESMYHQQKESSDGKMCSGKEMMKELSQLFQNFSVPEDFSENVKDKWEAVKNQSLEGWQLIMDIASMVTTGTTQRDDADKKTEQGEEYPTEPEDQSNSKPQKNDLGFNTGFDEEDVDSDDEQDYSNERNKRGSLPKWSETIQDVYNKTKSSMSDVSQQIKDTWEQVKNLSQDLWKEHEPSVTNLKEKVAKKVEKVSEKLTSWVTRRWNGNYKRHIWKTQRQSNEESSSQTGSTKRRSYTREEEEEKDKYWTSNDDEEDEEEEKDENEDEDNWEYSESVVKRYRRRFWKFRTKMDKLNLQKVMQMNLKHVRKGLNNIEKFFKKIDVRVLSPFNRKWLTCQQDWWFSRYNGVNMGSDCRDVLPCWQVSLANGRDPGNCNGNHGDDPHIRNRPQKGDRQRKDCNKNNRGQKRQEHKLKKQAQGSRHQAGTPNYQDEKNRRETFEEEFNDTNSMPPPSDKSVPFCDPASGNCPTTEPSWYIQQLKHREELRRTVGDETELDSNSDWMFTRAEDRDFQRTLPDDWYSRRLDSHQNRKNEYLGDEDDDYYDDSFDHE